MLWGYGLNIVTVRRTREGLNVQNWQQQMARCMSKKTQFSVLSTIHFISCMHTIGFDRDGS